MEEKTYAEPSLSVAIPQIIVQQLEKVITMDG